MRVEPNPLPGPTSPHERRQCGNAIQGRAALRPWRRLPGKAPHGDRLDDLMGCVCRKAFAPIHVTPSPWKAPRWRDNSHHLYRSRTTVSARDSHGCSSLPPKGDPDVFGSDSVGRHASLTWWSTPTTSRRRPSNPRAVGSGHLPRRSRWLESRRQPVDPGDEGDREIPACELWPVGHRVTVDDPKAYTGLLRSGSCSGLWRTARNRSNSLP